MLSKRTSTVATLTAAMLSVSTAATAATLATPFNPGGSVNGLMFDIVVGARPLRLETIAVNVANGTWDFDFYTVNGSIGITPPAWTWRDSFTMTPSAGIDALTSFDITDITLPANSTLGIYFINTIPQLRVVQYSNGPALGTIIASNGDLAIKAGFATTFHPEEFRSAPRSFKGAFTYSIIGGVPEPVIWTMLVSGFGFVGTALRWQSRAIGKA